ncbi:hypothetical protein [Arthrobacter sp. UYEF3]|uniref:hypothetical protein n=1 Tax=Arthrobacter sp. UYEF3 TaxID=1756365 RepID=UPI00339905BD
MTEAPRVWAMSAQEYEAMVLDDLKRPVMYNSQDVIRVLHVRDGGICGLCRTPFEVTPKERYDPSRPQADHTVKRAGRDRTPGRTCA